MSQPKPRPVPTPHPVEDLPGPGAYVAYVDQLGRQHGPMLFEGWQAYADAVGLGATPVTHDMGGTPAPPDPVP